MTDARYPERWLNDRRVLRLSDAGHRLFVTALAWSASNRADGVLHDDDLCLLPRVDPGCAEELAKSGLWERDRDCWVVIDYATTQLTAAQLAGLDHKRVMARERQARHRARVSAENEQQPPPVGVTRDVTRDEERHAERDVTCHATRETKVRSGQVRLGTTEQEQREKTRARARGTRIPDGFTVTPEMVGWARANAPDVDGRLELERFRDYWRAKSGKDATKTDWVATWRNWMRRAQDNARPTAPRRVATTAARLAEIDALKLPEEDQ